MMRVWEQDTKVLPQNYIVVRLDGRHFNHLTRDMALKKPFSTPFRDWMNNLTRYLMTSSGFNITYGYTQSDEISLLLALNDDTFARSERKIESVLAGEASAFFSLQIGRQAVFDARISRLPNLSLVADYFLWRQEDSARNSLNGYAFWKLIEIGKSKRAATTELNGMSSADKNEYLFTVHGINWNDVPLWQRRGSGFFWHLVEKEGFDPINNKKVVVMRRALRTELELPIGDSYKSMVMTIAQSGA